MCATLNFFIKYILFFVNIVFTLAGVVLVGLGVAVLVHISDILELIPVNLNAIPISIIVLGCVIFAIGFCGCYGAIKESSWLLCIYAVVMAVLIAIKIYLTVVLFQGLSTIQETTARWVVQAFRRRLDLFPALEYAFRCCGTTGHASYVGLTTELPPSCCGRSPSSDLGQCAAADAFDGCVDILGNYFKVFGDAIAGILIVVIAAELVAMVFGLCLANHARNKARRARY